MLLIWVINYIALGTIVYVWNAKLQRDENDYFFSLEELVLSYYENIVTRFFSEKQNQAITNFDDQ